ncbi:ABC transporter permease [Sinorhizobium meliloti]|uniref:ABC transporter permease n=2 Tax=Rhizobium meliloti TaxID=382 RepID=UPI000FD5DFCE|nr:ABC transporter permease [Sinorhizobium meliloti]MDW9808554.1 ABC transporter permease [Sinorhizobium meliloti]MDW9818160.1 ABC transporter permease [Sinorhizobium meliloti]MDW9855077.1 ABC transporter permease [Sinorhizobium meliloti]MDW9872723.1 ABC transporter permease [Sinorhizobium meliloti]MDW9886308.1 ABC transporter permease [Sinorhizobium meliloti]
MLVRCNTVTLAKTYIRVVAAMIAREMSTRFGRKPGGYIWALLEPAGYIAMMTVIFGALARAPALGTSFVLFFATGYLGYQLYQAKVIYLSASVKANKPLLSYPNVAPIDAVTARYILQTLTSALVAVMVFSTIFLTLHHAPEINWPRILEAEVYAGMLALGMGMFNSVMFVKSALYEQIYGIVTRPMFLLSGVFFLPDTMPHPYRDFLLTNPICQVIMLFRSGFYPEYRAIGLSESYLAICSAVILLSGMTIFTLSKKTLRND